MRFAIDLSGFERVHNYYSEFYSVKKNREEREYAFCGVVMTSTLDVGAAFTGKRSRYVTVPDRPTRFQKLIAYLCVQARITDFARKKNQWVDYAFSGESAQKIFKW